jgi:formylglycine-generating enzyme required for sulfatase activity
VLDKRLRAHRWGGGMHTLLNAGNATIDGPLLRLQRDAPREWWDHWSQRSCTVLPQGDDVILCGRIDGGAPALLAPAPPPLSAVAAIPEPVPGPQPAHVLRPAPEIPMHPAGAPAPEGMVRIPGGGYLWHVQHAAKAVTHGGCYGDHLHHTQAHRNLQFHQLGAYWIDRTEVTNAQFAEFLRETRWRPDDTANLLRHWSRPGAEPSSWSPPLGFEDHPVVWVALEDARAYAAWRGCRLPTEAEWQFCAEGPPRRELPFPGVTVEDGVDPGVYRWGLRGTEWPWGERFDPSCCNGDGETTTPVDAYPRGASRYGVLDLCGNVWEWTESEYTTGRTRYALLRGGCHHLSSGSFWYPASGPQPCDVHEKLPLVCPSGDRSPLIGFRTVRPEQAAGGSALTARDLTVGVS